MQSVIIKNNLIINTNQVPYCGTDYTIDNVPEDMTDEEVLRACGERWGFWVNRFERRGKQVSFNINYD